MYVDIETFAAAKEYIDGDASQYPWLKKQGLGFVYVIFVLLGMTVRLQKEQFKQELFRLLPDFERESLSSLFRSKIGNESGDLLDLDDAGYVYVPKLMPV